LQRFAQRGVLALERGGVGEFRGEIQAFASALLKL
jgi:hypothetical protein